jgi:LmbE family N-acetylglucosaminyl deacetylase
MVSIQPIPDDRVRRVLVVSAHPDDADFGAAGTIGGWVQAGIEVTLLCVTHGEQGARPDADISALAEEREREQRAASAEYGVSDVRFLDGHRDGWVEASFELQRDIVRVIRQVRPQRVLCQSPERWYDRLQASHPDHLAAGEATVRACYPAAENPFAWPELGLGFWHVGELWLMAHPSSDFAVDITQTFEAKVAALRSHSSQTGHRDELETMLRAWGSGIAEQYELPPGRLAEAFRIVPINMRAEDPPSPVSPEEPGEEPPVATG